MKKIKKGKRSGAQEANIQTHISSANIPTGENKYEGEEKTDNDVNNSALRKHVIKNIRKDPSITANSLKKWMIEDIAAES
jgi:flagellar M-ring protein FliF